MFLEAKDVKVSTKIDTQIASREFYSRPEDERYADLAALATAVQANEDASVASPPFPLANLAIEPRADGQGVLMGQAGMLDPSKGLGADPTPWAFSQVASLIGSPAGYLRSKSPESIARNMTEDVQALTVQGDERYVKAYVRKTPDGEVKGTLRALNGRDYTRLHDSWIVAKLQGLESQGWLVPPTWDGKPAGLYYSDRDLWAMMIDSPEASLVLRDKHSDRTESLHHMVILWNSVTGYKSIGACICWLNAVCGNHLLWGVRSMMQFRFRHRGTSLQSRATKALNAAFEVAALPAAEDDKDGILRAMDAKLADDDAKLVEVMVRRTGLPKSTVLDGITIAREEGSDPLYAWGAVQGLTALARTRNHADRRAELDWAAASLMPQPKGGKKASTVTVDV